MDLVGTCPMDFWEEWIAEGDAAGDPETGEEFVWHTRHFLVNQILPRQRFYIVAHGRLRGYAIVTRVHLDHVEARLARSGSIIRRGGAVACTIPETIKGFQGLRPRWWEWDTEIPFPDWKTEGVYSR